MPCQDCAGLHVELLTLKEFMAQWFTILMHKIESVEQTNNRSTQLAVQTKEEEEENTFTMPMHDPIHLFPCMAFTALPPSLSQSIATDDDGPRLNTASNEAVNLTINNDVNNNAEGEEETVNAEDSKSIDMSRDALAITMGPSKYTCRLCQSNFTQMSNLRRHVRVIHQGLTKHSCRYCGKVFAWKGAWRRHEQYVHEMRPNGGTTTGGGAAAPAGGGAPTGGATDEVATEPPAP